MIVCHCNAVRERAVRKAVREGARTRGAVARSCGAGSACGGCVPLVDEIVESEARREIGRALPFPSLSELATTA